MTSRHIAALTSRVATALAATLFSASALAAPELIAINADIHTVDPAAPRVQALAVEKGRFTAVGGKVQMRALAGAKTRVIDARGHTVRPGFIDAHSHVSGDSRAVAGVDIAYMSPLVQMADAIFRTSPFGFLDGQPWRPEQAVSFAQALHAYTQAGAGITPWKDQIGAITAGKWADFVLLDGAVPEPMDASFRRLNVART